MGLLLAHARVYRYRRHCYWHTDVSTGIGGTVTGNTDVSTGIDGTVTGTRRCYSYRWDFYWHTDVSTSIDGTVTGTRTCLQV